MKRKLAFLLAAVMLITAALPMNLLASTTSTNPNTRIRNYEYGSVLVDNYFYQYGGIPVLSSANLIYGENASATNANYGEGINLVIRFTEGRTVGTEGFDLTYDNATHAFYNNGAVKTYGGYLDATSYASGYASNVNGLATTGAYPVATTPSSSIAAGTDMLTTGYGAGDSANLNPVTVVTAAINQGFDAVDTYIGTRTVANANATTPKNIFDEYIAAVTLEIETQWAARKVVLANDTIWDAEVAVMLNVAETIYSQYWTAAVGGTYPLIAAASTASSNGYKGTTAGAFYATYAALDEIVLIVAVQTALTNNPAFVNITTTPIPGTIGAAGGSFSIPAALVTAYTAINPATDTVAAAAARGLLGIAANRPVTWATFPNATVGTSLASGGVSFEDSGAAKIFSKTDAMNYSYFSHETTAFTAGATADATAVQISANVATAIGYYNTLNAAAQGFSLSADFTAKLNAEFAALTNMFTVANKYNTIATPLSTARGSDNYFYTVTTATSGTTDPSVGTYLYDMTKYAQTLTGNSSAKAIPYTVYINPANPETATITITPGTVINKDDVLVFPMVMWIDDRATDVTYSINTWSPSVTPVSNVSIGSAGSYTGTTASSAGLANYARGRVYLKDITLTERALNSLVSGSFYIIPPAGYEFVLPAADDYTFSSAFNANPSKTLTYSVSEYYKSSTTDTSRRALRVNLGNISESRAVIGTITLKNLALTPLNNDPEMYSNIGTELSIVFRSPSWFYNASSSGNVNYAYPSGTAPATAGVTTATGSISLAVAKRMEYNITMKAATAVEAFSGRKDVATATVTIAEETLDTWNARKDTVFTVTDIDGNTLDQVKITKVLVLTSDLTKLNGANLSGSYTVASYANSITSYGTAFYNRDINEGITSTPVEYTNASFSRDGHTFRLTDLYTTEKKLATAALKFYLSADPNFDGDVYITMSGAAVSDNLYEEIEAGGTVKVATFAPPVLIDAETTDLQIGFQKYDVANVKITENYAAFGKSSIEVGKQIQLAIGEYGEGKRSDYMYFAPITKSDVILSGNDTTFNISEVTFNNSSKTLVFTVMRKSSTVGGEFTLTNLGLNADRTVPEGSYDLLVGGAAIVDNSISDVANYLHMYDRFNTWGVVKPGYVIMKTAGDNVQTQYKVEMTVGDDSITVNGVVKSMDAASFINPINNRTYVPIRFVAEAFGIGEIFYDDVLRKVVIMTKERNIEFFVDSSKFYVNGVEMTMFEEGVECEAINSLGRVYVPVRFVAYALNVDFDWAQDDQGTITIIFNPDK